MITAIDPRHHTGERLLWFDRMALRQEIGSFMPELSVSSGRRIGLMPDKLAHRRKAGSAPGTHKSVYGLETIEADTIAVLFEEAVHAFEGWLKPVA